MPAGRRPAPATTTRNVRAKKAPAPKARAVKAVRVMRQAAPKKRAKKTVNPSASLRHHDAMLRKDAALPVPGVQGSFVSVPTIARAELTTGTNSFFVVIQWTSMSCRGVQISANRVMTGSFMNNGTLASNPPTSLRAMAMSIRLRNTSVFTAQEGVVRVLSIPEQLAWEFDTDPSAVSQTFYDSLVSTMENHPQVQSYTAHDFTSTKRFVTAPASQVGFKSYASWVAHTGYPDHNNALKQGAAIAPMNVTILQFSNTSQGNTYDLCTHSLDAARFPVNTLYSALAKEPPASQEQAFNQGVQNVQRHAGMALDSVVGTG